MEEVLGVGGNNEGCDLGEGGRDEEVTRAEEAGFVAEPVKTDNP